MTKFVVRFKLTSKAKEYAKRVKKLPYVTYVTDYMYKSGRHVLVTIDGELTEAREKELISLKCK